MKNESDKMKRVIVLSLLLLLQFFSVAGQPSAELVRANKMFRSGKQYPALLRNIVLDGKLNDWDSIPFEDSLKYSVTRFVPPSGPEDASVRFKVAADEKKLFLLLLIQDDKIVSRAPFGYNEDSVEIFLSLGTVGRKKAGDVQIILSPKGENFRFSGSENFLRNFSVSAVPVKIEGGWGAEIAIPLQNDLFSVYPSEGLQLGFSLHYNDNDSGRRDHKIAWHPDPGDISWKSNDALGKIVFVTDRKLPVRPVQCAAEKDQKPEQEIAPSLLYRVPGSCNVLYNGSFRKGDAGFSQWHSAGPIYRIEKDPTDSYLSMDCRRVPSDAMTGYLCTRMFKVFPGEKYSLSFRARMRGGAGAIHYMLKDEGYQLKILPGWKLPADVWKRCTADFVIPPEHTGKNSLLQLMFQSKQAGGKILDITDLRLVRHVPARWDADFSFPGNPYSWWFAPGKDVTVNLMLSNSSSERVDLSAEFQIFNQITGKKIRTATARYVLAPQETRQAAVPCPANENGGYRMQVLLRDGQNNLVRREIEYVIAPAVEKQNRFGAVSIAHDIYLDNDADELAALAEKLGFPSARIFVTSIYPLADGSYDYASLDRLVNALLKRKIQTIACLPITRGTGRFPEFSPLRYAAEVKKLVEHFKGRIAFYEIGNECNLPGGWRPEPNVAEYSTLLRCAYAVIKETDSAAKVLNCGFSVLDSNAYTSEFLRLNQGNFYDMIAVHPYSVRGKRMDTESLISGIRKIREYHPAGLVCDTESGPVQHPFHMQVEYLAKKYPAMFHAGVFRHHEWGMDRSCSGHLFAPYNAPSPAVATYSFLNRFYDNRTHAAGEWNLGEFWNGYVVERDGVFSAAVWRERIDGPEKISLPVFDAAKVFDVFGNDITAAAEKRGDFLHILLPRNLPVFVTNIKPAPGSLRPVEYAEAGRKYQPCETSILLLPEYSRGFFQHQLIPGTPAKLYCNLANLGRRTADIRLTAKAPQGVSVEFDHQQVKLAPGESRRIAVSVNAEAAATGGILELSGVTGGRNLAALPVRLSIRSKLYFNVYGRHVEICNATGEEMSGTIYFSGKVLDVIPYKRSRLKIPAHGALLSAFEIAPVRKTAGPLEYPPDGKSESTATFIAEDGRSFRQKLQFQLLRVTPGVPPSRSGWFDSWTDSGIVLQRQGEPGRGRIKCRYGNGRLYLAIRVDDKNHIPEGEGGYLGKGDSVTIGIDPDFSAEVPTGYDADSFEAGFALGKAGDIQTYVWDGSYGLERARPFAEASVTIQRKGECTDYELGIPLKLPEKCDAFGLGIRITDLQSNGERRIFEFGDGLGEVRSARRFGTARVE